MPRVLRVNPDRPEPEAIAEAARVLEGGGLVAFPTETVYGLGARGLVAGDVKRIFAAKGRPPTHPLILHADGERMARSLAASFSEAAARLARVLWPGPLTLVVPRAPRVPLEVTGGLETVAVRVPAHPVALALITAVGTPLAAPSANAHTHVSPTNAAHVLRSLGDRVDLVLDGGPCARGVESTVVSVAESPPRVLRPGAASLEALRAIEPDVVYEPVTAPSDAARASPGMASKHYSPRAPVVLAEAGAEGVRDAIVRGGAGVVAAVVWSAEGRSAARSAQHVAILPDDARGYEARLFATLHDLDDAKVDSIVIERVPDDAAWWAVSDRLARAAAAKR